MRSIKIARFVFNETISSIRNFYTIFLLIITFFAVISTNSSGSVNSSGLELSSVIFLFVVGLNSLKSNFKFSQANNISRKTFFKGMIMGAVPITAIMSIVDLIINRINNIFMPSPTNFDMIYGSFRDTGMWNFESNGLIWKQANDFHSLLATVIWLLAIYTMVYLFGILISLIYYRSNKPLKVIISVIPVILILLSYNIYTLLPGSFWRAVGQFIANAFGWHSRNPYMAVLSISILGAVFSGFILLLIRKAVVKE